MILRDYQHQTHDAVFKEWETVQSTLAVLPTGAGKTIVFAHIIKSLQPARVMVLAHRDELITQARDKIERVTGLTVEIEKADQYASNNLFNKAPIVVSSIQTQISGPVGKRRYLRFNPYEFRALILDEAHHALSPSWREAIGYYCKNPNLKVLGCTATPDRADKLGLKAVFQSVAFNYGILDAMLDGWLVEIGQQFVPVKGLDFSHIRTTAGDLNEGDLAKLMEMEQNIQGICQPSIEAMWGLAPKTLSGIPTQDWKTHLEATGKTPRRSIVFTVSVEQARICSEVFSRTMNGVEWICGETRKEDRIQTLKRFASGDTHCVCNCLDSATEILTRRGWVGESEVKATDITATINVSDGTVTWQPISRIVRRERLETEAMIAWKNQSFDIRVTEGHRMVCRAPGAQSWGIREAKLLPDAKGPYEMPVSGIELNLPGVPLEDCDLEFLGLFASDGCLNLPRARIQIGQAKCYTDNCLEIERILTACQFDWRKNDHGTWWDYQIPKGNIGGQLKRRGWVRLSPWIGKSLCDRLREMTVHQFERLLFGLWLGDGDKHYHRERRRANPGVRFSGIDWVLLDRVQAWGVVRGYAANLSIRANTSGGRYPKSVLGHLSLRKRATIRTNNRFVPTSGGNPAKVDSIFKNEVVWCVTNQNGTIVTRRNGKVMIMGQCGILLEGFDNPAVELIVMARPTKSRSLYAQCCGRSLRPLPGVVDGLATKELRRAAIQDSAKPIARILDFVGNAGKHKLITSCDILGGRVSEEAVEAAKSKTLEDGTVKRILKTLSDVESELQRKKQQAIEEAAKCEAARKARLLARVDYSLRNVDPFGGPVTRIASSISRDGHPFSEKQARLLQRNGYDPKTLRYGAGKAIIGKLFEKNGWNKKTAQSARLATIGKEPF